jgi:sulfur carrier protein ThiS
MARTPAPRRRTASNAVQTITVTIRPVWGETKTLSIPVDSTVEDLLNQNGYNASTEVRLISGRSSTVLSNDAILEEGDVIQVVSNKKVANG